MPLPKGIKAALDAWKAGSGEFPTELDDGVFFPSTGAFDAEVGRKLKGRESQAKDAATAKFLAELGLTDESEIAAVKETLDKSGVLKTETDKLKTQLAKAAKDLEDSRKESETLKTTVAQHAGKLKDVAKRDALMKYAPQVVDTEVFSDLVGKHLEVADDGTVTVKGDGKKSLDDVVKDTLTAKPYLKSPTFKEGPGTKPTPKTETNVVVPFTTSDPDKAPLTVAQRMMNELVANGSIKPPAAGTPGGGP